MYVPVGEGSNTPFQSARFASSREFADRRGFVEVPRTDRHVVRACVVLTSIIGKVLFARKVFDVEFPMFDSICNPKNLISMAREHCRLTVLFAMPTAVELSQFTGIAGCGWPSSSSATRKIATCLQLRKRAPSSASAAEATTKRKTAQSVKNASLSLIGFVASGFHPMKKWPQTWCVLLIRKGRKHRNGCLISCRRHENRWCRRDGWRGSRGVVCIFA